MKKIKFLTILGILLCTFFIVNLNYKASANDNFMRLKTDNVTYTLKDTGSLTALYEVKVTINTTYQLKTNVVMYFKPNVNYTLRTPINRGYNSYRILTLNKTGTNKWELRYEIALSNTLMSDYDGNIEYVLTELINIFAEAIPSVGDATFSGEQPLTIKGINGNYNYTRLTILGTRQAELVFNFPHSLINQNINIQSIDIQNVTTGINYTNLIPIYEYHPNPRFIWRFDYDFFQEGKNTLYLYKITISVSGVTETIDLTRPLTITAIDSQLYADIYYEVESHSYNEAYDSGYEIGYDNGYAEAYDKGYDVGYNEAYDIGYNDGYDKGLNISQGEAYEKGYKDGSNKSFIGTIDKWLVPSIIIVMLIGGFFAIARKKRDGDI